MAGCNIINVVLDIENSGEIDRGKRYVPLKESDQVRMNKIADRFPGSKYQLTYYQRFS